MIETLKQEEYRTLEYSPKKERILTVFSKGDVLLKGDAKDIDLK